LVAKLRIFHTPAAFNAPVKAGVGLPEFGHNISCGKTMVGLSKGEKVRGQAILMVYTNVTDGPTDSQPPHHAIGRSYV